MVSGIRGPGGPTRTDAVSLTPTGPFSEHRSVGTTLKALAKAALEGGASSTMFLPATGVRYDAYNFSYHTGLSKEMNVKVAPKDGKIRGTICINISGHADGSRADMLVAAAGKALQEQHGINWWRDVDDKTFAALRGAAEKAAWSGDFVVDVAGLPKLTITRADIDKFAATPNAKWDASDSQKRFFAMTNTYNVRVLLPNGEELNLRNVARNKADSAEYSTRIPIEFPALEGTTIIEAWPSGSAGVAGYSEARQYKMHLGEAHQFDVKAAEVAVEKFKAAHPEVRWGTRHEDDDMEKHHCPPLPTPYTDSP